MKEETEEELIKLGMEYAQKRAHSPGLDASLNLSHPSDLRKFQLLSTDLETAEVAIFYHSVCPSKVLDKKVFPFKELFNRDVALRHGKKLKRRTQH